MSEPRETEKVPIDKRRAQVEAEQEHGRLLAERYGHEKPRPRLAAVGHAESKRRRLK